MGPEYSYILKRMKRKSLKLFISDNGDIMVYAPIRADKKTIDAFVAKNSAWIEEHLETVRQQNMSLEKHLSSIRFIGRDIKVKTGKVIAATLDGDILYVPDTTVQKERKLITDWYKRQAEALLTMRTDHWAKIMDCDPGKINITNARKRWGSCSSEGTVSYSWRLITAGREEIDYVIIHELSHLKYLNHSKQFWAEVERYCPNYKQSEKDLDEVSRYLKINGWTT